MNVSEAQALHAEQGEDANVCRQSPHRWCLGMSKMIAEANVTNGKGLRPVLTLNLKAQVGDASAVSMAGVKYCTLGSTRSPHLMLNFCPWCGESLAWWK